MKISSTANKVSFEKMIPSARDFYVDDMSSLLLGIKGNYTHPVINAMWEEVKHLPSGWLCVLDRDGLGTVITVNGQTIYDHKGNVRMRTGAL